MIPSTVLVLALLPTLIGSVEEKIPADALAALENADHFELLSLDPAPVLQEKPENDFHGWKVLGMTEVKDAKTRQKLVVALRQGAKESNGKAARCFNPRHGIRVTGGGKTYDFVVCFECFSAQIIQGGQRSGFLTTASPQPVFDQVLRDAGVPLPQKLKS